MLVSLAMAKSKKREDSLLNGESHAARLKRLYGDKFSPETKNLVDETLASQSLITPKLPKEAKEAKPSEAEYSSLQNVPIHPFDDAPDPLSPPFREGRRIAQRREDRDKSFLLKLAPDEHDTIRRVAHWYGYSLSQTYRILAREKEDFLWPDKVARPSVLELDIDAKKRKTAAKKKTDKWVLRRRNSLQRREAKLRKEVAWTQARQAKLKEREEYALTQVKQMEAIRSEKNAGTMKMYKEINHENFANHEVEKEDVTDVTVALIHETNRLKRPLTETEKWEIGNRVRIGRGGPAYQALDEAVARRVLDEERKLKRKLTLVEQWEIRKKVRKKNPVWAQLNDPYPIQDDKTITVDDPGKIGRRK